MNEELGVKILRALGIQDANDVRGITIKMAPDNNDVIVIERIILGQHADSVASVFREYELGRRIDRATDKDLAKP